MSAEWVDFSFVRNGEGCLVCSMEEADALIASGELTAATRVTMFGPGGRKVMKAGELPLLAPVLAPPAVVAPPEPAAPEDAAAPAEPEEAGEAAVSVPRTKRPGKPKDAAKSEAKDGPWTVAGAGELVPGGEAAASAEPAAPAAAVAAVAVKTAGSAPVASVGQPAPLPPRPAAKPKDSSGPGCGCSIGLIVLLIIAALMWFNNSNKDEQVQVLVTSTANVRDRPTAEGSTVLFSYQAGQELVGHWVPGEINPQQQWLEIEVDGEKRYVWAGNLQEQAPAADAEADAAAAAGAAAAAAGAAAASEPVNAAVAAAAAAVAPLGNYVGGYPSDYVGGVNFWGHPVVVAAVRQRVVTPDAVNRILTSGVEIPITQSSGWVIASGCEPRNCNGQNWTVSITEDGVASEVCYFNSAGGPIASGYYGGSGYQPLPNNANNGQGCWTS